MLSKSLYPSSLYEHTRSSLLWCDYKICIEDVVGAVESRTTRAEAGGCGWSNACQVQRGGAEIPRIPRVWIYDEEEPRESSLMSQSLSPHLECFSSDSHLHVLFPQLSQM